MDSSFCCTMGIVPSAQWKWHEFPVTLWRLKNLNLSSLFIQSVVKFSSVIWCWRQTGGGSLIGKTRSSLFLTQELSDILGDVWWIWSAPVRASLKRTKMSSKSPGSTSRKEWVMGSKWEHLWWSPRFSFHSQAEEESWMKVLQVIWQMRRLIPANGVS